MEGGADALFFLHTARLDAHRNDQEIKQKKQYELLRYVVTYTDGQTADVHHHPRLVTDDMAVLHQAAIDGVGIAQLPTIMIWQDIEAGRLIHVLPDWRPRAGIVHAVFPSRRGLLPSVRALLDFLARECTAQRKQAASMLKQIEGETSP